LSRAAVIVNNGHGLFSKRITKFFMLRFLALFPVVKKKAYKKVLRTLP